MAALQHLLFCERQCALIHLEQTWAENRFTAEGRVLHRNAHEGPAKTRNGVRTTRGLPLCSFELGLSGQADVVEWHPPAHLPDRQADRTLARWLSDESQKGLPGWTVIPLEYKRGRPKTNDCDRVQLCAQAICLEEMLQIDIPSGQIFYGRQRRRQDVEFDETLRQKTRDTARRVRELMQSRMTPRAVREKKCETCSLLPVCLPEAMRAGASARQYFDIQLKSCLTTIPDQS